MKPERMVSTRSSFFYSKVSLFIPLSINCVLRVNFMFAKYGSRTLWFCVKHVYLQAMENKKKSRKTKAELLREIELLKEQLEFLKSSQSIMPIYGILLDESTDPIFAIDEDGKYLYVNEAFATGVGKDLREILNHRIWDVFPHDEAEKRYTVVKWVFENRAPKVFEVRVPRADGDRYYITSVKPVFNQQGQVIMVNAISKEITERKLMEEELRRLSNHDLLTGLFSRNFYEGELSRLQQSRLFPISIVIADIA
jgi:PAS domain S-box-containing protein